MCLEKKITISSGGLSLTIVKGEDDELSLSLYGGRYTLPKFQAYNLKTGLFLLKGWVIITTSVYERADYDALLNLLEDELGGEVTYQALSFVRFGKVYKLSTNANNPNTWWIIDMDTKEAMEFGDCCDDYMRYSFFNIPRS